MTTSYPVNITVTLRPTDPASPARVLVSVDNDQQELIVKKTTTVSFLYLAQEQSQLTVEVIDQEGVEIVSVEFFGINDPKFAWSGIYTPNYPEPWATEQQNQGVVLKQHLGPHTYLGWPGKWTLTFDVPVFTWIHRVQNLGWIYG